MKLQFKGNVTSKPSVLGDEINVGLIAGHVFSVCTQAYKAALESLGHSEYALKAGFHLNPKAVEAALQVGSRSKSVNGMISREE